MYKVLIIEDEAPIAELLKYALNREDMSVFIASTGAAALARLEQTSPDIILLDLMLPDMDGLEICRRVTQERNIPIVILSAKSDQVDKLIGLEYGADDYITKPFDLREVVLRIRSILRRVEKASAVSDKGETLGAGKLLLDIGKHEASYDGERIDLTPKEFAVLELLLRNKGSVLSRTELLDKVWDYEYLGDTRTVDIHIQRLRRKLKHANVIVTIFGLGYKIEDEAYQGEAEA